jgi:hypothetical protein
VLKPAGSEDVVTVYAYKVRHQARFGVRTSDPWYGLPREGFQPGPLVGPQQVSVSWRYTVTAGERDRAIALGARQITQREVARIERQRAGMPGVI